MICKYLSIFSFSIVLTSQFLLISFILSFKSYIFELSSISFLFFSASPVIELKLSLYSSYDFLLSAIVFLITSFISPKFLSGFIIEFKFILSMYFLFQLVVSSFYLISLTQIKYLCFLYFLLYKF